MYSAMAFHATRSDQEHDIFSTKIQPLGIAKKMTH